MIRSGMCGDVLLLDRIDLVTFKSGLGYIPLVLS
jgi:hypothetical protein